MKAAGLGGGVVAVLLGVTSLAAQAVDRAKPPALPPPPALKLPAVQTAALANGLELAVVEMHKVPVVDVQLVLDAGAARDPVDLPGLATFTATMLQQGAGRRGALEIADEAAFLGAQLNTAASYDPSAAAPHRAVGRVGARVGARPAWGGGAGAGVPRGIPRRQTGCRTVGDPHRARRGGAHDAGLLRAPGPEHHPRRVVYVAA